MDPEITKDTTDYTKINTPYSSLNNYRQIKY